MLGSFTVNLPISTTTLIVLAVIMWLGNAATGVGIGLFLLHRRQPWKAQIRAWTKQFERWNLEVNGPEGQSRLDALWQAWRPVGGWAQIGAGLGVLVAFLAVVSASLLLTGTLRPLATLGVLAFYPLSLLFGVVGYVLGLGYGVLQLRRRHRNSPRYGDVRPRRLDSYRSQRVPICLTLLVAFYLVETVLVAPYLPPTFLLGSEWFHRPPPVVAAPTVLAGITILVMESLAAWIISLPRAVTGVDSEMAMRLDDLARARMIRIVEAAETVVVGGLGAILSVLLMGEAHVAAIVHILRWTGLVLPFIVFGFGALSMSPDSEATELTGWFYVPRGIRWLTRSSS